MPNKRKPRSGSLQFWPRKRARRSYARIRTFPQVKEAKLLGFAGYKVGMTHVIAVDNNKFSPTKGEEISIPVTIVECPPLKVAGMRFYKKTPYGKKTVTEVWSKPDKDLSRRMPLPKKEGKKIEDVNPGVYDDLVLIVYSQPNMTQIGKKKPELFELGIGGTKDEKLAYATDKLGKEIMIQDVYKEGNLCDCHAVTKGKGFQGPVKRFGVHIRESKSEKAIRNPGSLGPWCGQGHIMWRVPHAGKMGYHMRTHYNKQILKISNETNDVTPKGGFLNYGNIKNSYILVKGSLPGARKRTIIFTDALRSNKRVPSEAPSIEYISVGSKQGK